MSLMNSAGGKSTGDRKSKFQDLQEASEDFCYLLNHGYPRKGALELVGNRYGLTFDERHLLHRGVFSDADSESRQKKRIPIERIRNKDVAIDGYNVIITIEAGLSGRPLILGDDGFIRDISGLSGNFRKTERTEKALQLVLDALKRATPRQALFLFDAPISNSGKLAQEVRTRLKREDLPGDAKAVKVPEKILIGYPGLIATSDTAIIDRSKKVVDLAGDILRSSQFTRLKPAATYSLIRWRRKRSPFGKT
jgi:hypothetical protein